MEYKITWDIKNKTRPLNPIPLPMIYWTPITHTTILQSKKRNSEGTRNCNTRILRRKIKWKEKAPYGKRLLKSQLLHAKMQIICNPVSWQKWIALTIAYLSPTWKLVVLKPSFIWILGCANTVHVTVVILHLHWSWSCNLSLVHRYLTDPKQESQT